MVKPESVSPGAAVLVSCAMAEVGSSVAVAVPDPWLVVGEGAGRTLIPADADPVSWLVAGDVTGSDAAVLSPAV